MAVLDPSTFLERIEASTYKYGSVVAQELTTVPEHKSRLGLVSNVFSIDPNVRQRTLDLFVEVIQWGEFPTTQDPETLTDAQVYTLVQNYWTRIAVGRFGHST